MTSSEPTLTALMCDGMGWFSATDYKRAVLLYDKIHYLLPRDTVEFEDIDGQRRTLLFPQHLYKSRICTVSHFDLSPDLQTLVRTSAAADVADPDFLTAVAGIPEQDQAYGWRVANASSTFATSGSLGLHRSQRPLAQSLLLNHFLLAADSLGHIPITGRRYLHGLIAAKYARAAQYFASAEAPIRVDVARALHPVAVGLASGLVPDEDLERRSEEDILEYKDKNRLLFRDFTAELLQLTASLTALPGTREFEAALLHSMQTAVWQKRSAIQADFQASWQAFFKTTAKAAVTGVLGLGVAPLLPLGALVAAAAAGAGTWLVPDLMDILAKFRKARSHGLYYLMGLNS